MATTFLKVDVSKIEGLGERLGKLSGEEIAQATVTALNDVVGSTYDITRKRMVSQVNLDDPYIRGKMDVVQATVQKPKASIVAFGKREDEVPLSRYPNQLILAPRKTTGTSTTTRTDPTRAF